MNVPMSEERCSLKEDRDLVLGVVWVNLEKTVYPTLGGRELEFLGATTAWKSGRGWTQGGNTEANR